VTPTRRGPEGFAPDVPDRHPTGASEPQFAVRIRRRDPKGKLPAGPMASRDAVHCNTLRRPVGGWAHYRTVSVTRASVSPEEPV
jgi:hypothetical protein